MNTPLSLFGLMAQGASLGGPIGPQFANRPSLLDVAATLVHQQWLQRSFSNIPPATLTLVRAVPGAGFIRQSLAQALIERHCQDTPINLDDDLDFLSFSEGPGQSRRADIPLHPVEVLLNECAPFLLDAYKQALADFWWGGESGAGPGAWLAGFLQEHLKTVCRLKHDAGELDSLEAATAMMIATFPAATQRATLGNLADTRAQLMNLDMTLDWHLTSELASMVLIERVIPEQSRTLVLLYSLAGQLYSFESLERMTRVLSVSLLDDEPLGLNLYATDLPIFNAQVYLLFEEQLALIDREAAVRNEPVSVEDRAARLQNDLDRVTSLLEVSLHNQWQALEEHRNLLPRWLVEAPKLDSRRYLSGLIGLAALQKRTQGRSFLFDILPILEHAAQVLRAALQADHPQASTPDVEDIELVNYQVIAAPIGHGGEVNPGGTLREVSFSLAQFALENVQALHAGRVEVRLRSGAQTPSWLSVDYLKALVQRLDIGQRYPQLLQRRLLDDPLESATREQLFVEQLREQLPMLALQRQLSHEAGVSAESVARIEALLWPTQGEALAARVMLLSFVRAPGAAADVALNAFLIEGPAGQGPCLLYRPLHRDSLLQFPSREDFFAAVCDSGDLQDDLLARLDSAAQPIYGQGGFEQPHIVRFGLGGEFSPVEVPAPATLGDTPLSTDLLPRIYRDSARELVTRAQAQSVSNAENRWLGYQQLGWLMYNTLLPLVNGPVAVAAWMLPLLSNLQSDLQHPVPDRDGERIAGFLFNLALLLFSFRTETSRLEKLMTSPAASAPSKVPAQVREVRLETTVPEAASAPVTQLDFSWLTASQQLSSQQQTALATFRTDLAIEQLGAPIPHGPWQGLWLREQQFLAAVDTRVYAVRPGDEGVRIVDHEGREGPWLRRDEEQGWQLDLKPRLRGGMPVNRRIEKLRAANQQRIVALEQEQAGYLAQRLASTVKIKEHLDVVAAQREPQMPSLLRYAADLRSSCELRAKAHEGFKALNQLKTQPHYNRTHAEFLYGQAAEYVQLVYVLRHEFTHFREQIRNAHMQVGQEAFLSLVERPESGEYQQLMASFRDSGAVLDELLACYERALALKRELAQVPPTGASLAERLQTLMAAEPQLNAWRSINLNMLLIVILDAGRTGVGNRNSLRDILRDSRVGMQMQVDLEGATELSEKQKVDVLDSCAGLYTKSLEGLRLYRQSAVPAQLTLLDKAVQLLETLLHEAETELAELIRALSHTAEHPVPTTPGSASRVVIRTRNCGLVVGRRRKGEGGKPDVVEVTDAIENDVLARYEESADSEVWQPVLSPEKPLPPSTVGLPALLSRSAQLLGEADRQMQKARSQSLSATIPVEMEEILVQQAKPLEVLSQQIDSALIRGNATDAASAGLDASVQVRALVDKAQQMRDEGRNLRIAIIKAQPPTAARIDYLKSQGKAVIVKLAERKLIRRKKGQPLDYLQEYVVQDEAGQALWYAHFHYASTEALDKDFTAGHLKTVAQRFEGGQYRVSGEANNQKVIQIYRSLIDRALAQRLFFSV